MITADQLRLAVALTHTVPGVELQLITRNGERTVVSRHPAGDIDPCSFRRTIVAAGPNTHTDPFNQIEEIRIGGSLRHRGGGLMSSQTPCGLQQRWLASTLPWCAVRTALGEVGAAEIPEGAMEATIKPDPDLDVSLVVITAIDRRYDVVLERMGNDLVAAVLAEELVRSTAVDAAAPDPIEPER